MHSAVRASEATRRPSLQNRPDTTCSGLKTHFYQCQFEKLLSEIEKIVDLQSYPEQQYIEVQLLKANALHELDQGEESLALLKGLWTFRQVDNRAAYLYSLARISYHDGNYEKALSYFEEIINCASDVQTKFRGFLGAANVYYSLDQLTQIPPLLAQLEMLKNRVAAEDQISLSILYANYYRLHQTDGIMAEKYFQQALGLATQQSWPYFMMRCIYGLAMIAQERRDYASSKTLQSVLDAMLKNSETIAFANIVKTRLNPSPAEKNFIQLRPKELKLKIAKDWLDLHKKPLIFGFINALYKTEGFLDKASMSRQLWPGQQYLPHTHDPRIYDLAKRVKQLLFPYSDQITLLTGRKGYKLMIPTQPEDVCTS